MILRLWRARLGDGSEPGLLDRLRVVARRLQAADLPIDFTYGFRHEGGRTIFLTLSTWPDFDSILDATHGDPSVPIGDVGIDDLIEDRQAVAYEEVPSAGGRVGFSEGRVVAIVTARVKPQHEAAAQEMVDRSAIAAIRAGALAAHLGRRLDSEVVELAIVVVWPRRDAMTRFVRSRDIPAIDPAFEAHLSGYRFETYTALAPERLMISTGGPAILVMDDDGRFVDTTPGVENVLGIPGELLHDRSILDLAPDAGAAADFRRRFLQTGVSHGTVDIRRPDGELVRARYRSVEGIPAPGLRSAVLSLPSEAHDDRPTADIVLEALGVQEAVIAQ